MAELEALSKLKICLLCSEGICSNGDDNVLLEWLEGDVK